MFAYSDPTETDSLLKLKALEHYRQLVHAWYRQMARLPNSAFTLLDAFTETHANTTVSRVSWIAFPKNVSGSYEDIDRNRFELQEEYVEWHVQREPNGNIRRITFTTEFSEYYEALARVGVTALGNGIKNAIPKANSKTEELFGPNFDAKSATPEGRAAQFRSYALQNPWNNGEKGILFLSQGANTMGTLFQLIGRSAIPRSDISAGAVCGSVGGACVPNRNSDPRICEAVQGLARTKAGLSLQDPVGIRIFQLQGSWKIKGRQVDINDPEKNDGVWQILRNGRRATLDVGKGLTMGDDPITSGAQVATKLLVDAAIVSAPEISLPAWAKMGQESTRAIV